MWPPGVRTHQSAKIDGILALKILPVLKHCHMQLCDSQKHQSWKQHDVEQHSLHGKEAPVGSINSSFTERNPTNCYNTLVQWSHNTVLQRQHGHPEVVSQIWEKCRWTFLLMPSQLINDCCSPVYPDSLLRQHALTHEKLHHLLYTFHSNFF